MERKNPFTPLSQVSLPPDGAPVHVGILRGNSMESTHRVHMVECDSNGSVVRAWGNRNMMMFPRSSVKMMQAFGWIEDAEKFGLGEREIALSCGSHHGESVHEEVVRNWLTNLNLTSKDLECGVHDPTSRKAYKDLIKSGKNSCEIHNNCSGKHCGFLTLCKVRGWDVAGYSNYDHPVQEYLRHLMTEIFSEDFSHLAWGIDGCGIPSYQISLEKLALGASRLACPERLGRWQGVAERVNAALKKFPLMIGGTDSFSSKVIQDTEGRVLAKVGAEGVYTVWMPEEQLGFALKVEDGNPRAAEVVISALMNEYGYSFSYSPLVKRWGGEIVGQMICG